MKLIFFFLFFSISAWANVQLELSVENSSPKQGEIVPARLTLKETQGQVFLSGINGKNFNKTLYVLSLSPFVIKGPFLEADAKIIFLKVPEGQFVSETVNGQEVAIHWNNIRVIGIETPQSFLLGDFEIPQKKKIVLWILITFGILGLVWMGYWITRKIKKKDAVLSRNKSLKQDLLNCHSYDQVVIMWKKKRIFLNEFPQLDEHFKELEKVLFKYQFKPSQSVQEISEVLGAYEKFKADVTGVLNGI